MPIPPRPASTAVLRMVGYGAAATVGGMVLSFWLPKYESWIGGLVMGVGMLCFAAGMARLGGDEGPGREFRWAGAASGFAVGLFLAAALAVSTAFMLLLIMDVRGNF